ncbi:MAG: ABC transporter permease subunit [Campylobacterota bacterium]|nr:ABC transporter permease subunit [Campylobacterota bacterium]
MLKIAYLTLKGSARDRIFIVIFAFCVLFFFIPVFSSFSMRQIQEVSITMSLNLNSAILLFLSIFGGVSTIWRDVERKYIYNVLSHPIRRTDYILGRFLGLFVLMFMVSVINFILSVIDINISASMYKSQLSINYINIMVAFLFSLFKYTLLMAFAFLVDSFATSFFMPFFLTIAIFLAGNTSQGVYEYIMEGATKYSVIFKDIVTVIYYILPNFSSFDFTPQAVYNLSINLNSIFLTIVYFILYFAVVMTLTCWIFERRNLT